MHVQSMSPFKRLPMVTKSTRASPATSANQMQPLEASVTPLNLHERRPDTTVASLPKRGLISSPNRVLRPNTTSPQPTQLITLISSVHNPPPMLNENSDEVMEDLVVDSLARKKSETPPLSAVASTPREELQPSPYVATTPPPQPLAPPEIVPSQPSPPPPESPSRRPLREDVSAPSPSRTPPQKIRIGKKELIGRGQFGTVYRATDLDSGRTVAVKEIFLHMESQDLRRQLMHLQRELRLMQSFDHPNIVKYLGARRNENELNIFMEYCPRGSIASILRSQGPFSETAAIAYITQILNGLAYLHQRSVAHRDLKGENMLVGDDGVLKLADFGTSKELHSHAKSVAGTAQFMAPEVITCVGHTLKADIWSVGCCCIEMLTGKPPFSAFDNQYAVMMRIARGETQDQIPPGISDACREFISACLRSDPTARPTCTELLRHRWLTGRAPSPLTPPPLSLSALAPADEAHVVKAAESTEPVEPAPPLEPLIPVSPGKSPLVPPPLTDAAPRMKLTASATPPPEVSRPILNRPSIPRRISNPDLAGKRTSTLTGVGVRGLLRR